MQAHTMKNKIVGFCGALLLMFVASGALLSPFIAGAQGNPGSTESGASGNPRPSTPLTNTKFENPVKVGSVEALIFLLVDVALEIGVVVAALALIWVGFLYVAARGNPDKISEAHHALFYTIVGIAVLFGSKVIIEIIKGTIEPIAPGLFNN